MSLPQVLMVCVYYQFLRHLPESCLPTLLKLFNNIWTTGDIPPFWREASVVPIPKPGKDPSDPSNYRPIALTSCLCKTLERMVNDRLVHVVESRNLLSNVQCGFRKDHSTLNHLCPPPWEEHNITVDISLTKQNKKNTSEVPYQKEFFRIKEKFSNHYAIFTDGSKLEEKVEAAAYFPENPNRSKATRLRDGASVFSAELEGKALALTEIKKLTKYHKNFVIYSDSLSALQAIQSKNFKVIDVRRLYNLIRKFPPYVHISFVWIPAHVGIGGNENVDKLAKAALNRTSTSGKLICYSDLKPKINTYIKSVWQRDWDAEGANKLHEVLPNLGEDLHRRGEGADRKLETAMCRLRVGHTWLTQSYLLKNEDQPFCYACDSLYTVR
ncbi:Pol-like protein [Plakobranchus ocellatus]|uniref:Pol-like protein n=1 Tax=Plakobranchus ocellatus TaxID=259542 RepID=A0AAV4BBI5_9GAST|nr:Pol-like protein [Plakobranchus ocellatus]